MSRTPAEPVILPRVVVDKPSRQPLDHPGRLPDDVGPHPTAQLDTEPRRLRVHVTHRSRPE
jgi:hypothetical protein